MRIPTIHMNGDSAEGLLGPLRDAAHALNAARDALCKTAPNGRNFYVQQPGALEEAQNEHFTRLEKLQDVYKELEVLAAGIYAQGEGKSQNMEAIVGRSTAEVY